MSIWRPGGDVGRQVRRRVIQSCDCQETIICPETTSCLEFLTRVSSLGHQVLSRKLGSHRLFWIVPVTWELFLFIFSISRVVLMIPAMSHPARHVGIIWILCFIKCLGVKDEPLCKFTRVPK